ncbi:hypothetical protein Cni_G17775 [Canna indica]|uniref:NB-ARC domain-containing protein n=1 Tax=Canna indica TaxID=4628 RepID=A0AAQ3KJH1_9LILI|nr:hypothetical protein Cni_G17775 [Canna indica]
MPTIVPSILSACGSLLTCCKDCCCQSSNYAVTYKQTITNLEIKVEELSGKYKDLETKIEANKRDDLKPLEEVLVWLDSAAKRMIEAKRIINKYKGITKCFSVPVNVCSGYLLKSKAIAAHTTIYELCTKEFPTVAHDRQLDRVRGRVMPHAIFGMKTVFQELQQHARNDAVSIIGIYGMASVGKTVLLEKFNNDFLESEEGREDPDVVIFLELQRSHTVENIQKSLFSRLNIEWRDDLNPTERAARISRVLSKSKFVLLLDNLWETLNYQIVGIPLPQSGSKCKIIFTTRMEDVCDHMGADKRIKVECLPVEEAWRFFQFIGRINDSTNPCLRDNARILAEMCGGLPAALITVGQKMATQRACPELMHTISIMKNTPFQLQGMKEKVLDPLKLSYDQLSDESRRAAFYFVLSNGDHLPRESLIEQWIGEGIINKFENRRDAITKASYLLRTLCAASLIQNIHGVCYRMHPMVRAMILWVSCECGERENKWLVQQDVEVEKWRVAERIASEGNRICALPDELACPHLVFLNLKYNILLKNIPNGLFCHMPCLKILDLQGTAIEALPAAVGKLVMLQFLNISNTKITSLPSELGDLVNLKYFAMCSTNCLVSIPDQVISKLQQLQWLDMQESYDGWRLEATEEGGVFFGELESLEKLKVLGITIRTVATLERLSGCRNLAASTCWLTMKECRSLKMLDASSLISFFGQNMRNIQTLRLHAMSDLEEVNVNDISHLLNPEVLHLSSLKVRLIGECSPRELKIEDCEVERRPYNAQPTSQV